MYISEQISQPDDETFIWNIPTDWNFRILQLTDLQAMAFFESAVRNGVIRWMSAWYRRPGWCQRG